ncbi:MAG: mandelate racemase/muconate lactonizing enzyme family protein [Desulfobacterales bacterium]|nr:mandelate racemase/muconate lactonizing enzyme family protein [Desulfobacterales bacterium]
MRIVEVKEETVSIASQIKNAYIDFSKMTVSALALVTDVVRDGKPVVGYGFNSNGRYAQGALLRERFIPRLMSADPETLLDETDENFDPFKIWQVLMKNEKPGGHGERSVAVGVIDMALWDAVAKIAQKPLYRLLAERFRNALPDEKVFVYAAGGYYYPGKGLDELCRELENYLALGYRTVKMKIGAVPLSQDIERIEAVLGMLTQKYPDQEAAGNRLAVDANGRFDLETAVAYGRALEPFNLFWYEEAGDPLDFALQAELAGQYRPALATGENLFSHQDAANLIRYAGMRPDTDYLQMDPVLSYGLVEYMRMLDVLKSHGWSWRRCIPHGGHQFALHIAAGLGLGGNESYPGIFAPFGGFADTTPVENGTIGLTQAPGIGFEEKSELISLFRKLFG